MCGSRGECWPGSEGQSWSYAAPYATFLHSVLCCAGHWRRCCHPRRQYSFNVAAARTDPFTTTDDSRSVIKHSVDTVGSVSICGGEMRTCVTWLCNEEARWGIDAEVMVVVVCDGGASDGGEGPGVVGTWGGKWGAGAGTSTPRGPRGRWPLSHVSWWPRAPHRKTRTLVPSLFFFFFFFFFVRGSAWCSAFGSASKSAVVFLLVVVKVSVGNRNISVRQDSPNAFVFRRVVAAIPAPRHSCIGTAEAGNS